MSFREAIAFTQQWLQKVEQSELTETEVLADMTELLSYPNGVRGFFVVYLTGASPLADQPPATFLKGFRATASTISSILVKNVAMSTAMAITHKRNNDSEQQAASETVQRRSLQLLQSLESEQRDDVFKQERLQLLKATQTEAGDYADFLDRWNYDAEQRQAIQSALENIN
ncbi:MAG: hypothetical protein WBB82_02685 [Limnothrix sp.]